MRDLIPIVISQVVAIIAAAIFWGWWRSPIPTFLIFTAALHGMMLGAALMWILGRWPIESRGRRALIGATAGLVSLIALTVGQYVTDAHAYHGKTQRAMAELLGAPRATTSPTKFYDDNVLKPVTGRKGVIGYVLFRDAQPWRRGLRTVEALLVVGLATGLAAAAGERRVPTVN